MTHVNELIQSLILMFGNIEALITALVSVIGTAIAAYYVIRKKLAEGEFRQIVAPLSTIAETEPEKLFDSLICKPAALDSELRPVSRTELSSNDGKALITAQAAIERARYEKPKLLGKLGINSAADAVPLVSALYQSVVKPIVKGLKK